MSLDSILPPRGPGPAQYENIDLTDLILSEYEILIYQQPGYLRFNNVGHMYNYGPNPIINPDNVTILKHDEDGVTWEFNVTNLGVGIDAGTVQSASREAQFQDKYKIRHEFVAEGLNRCNTDKRLREVFEEERDEDDNLTPDFVWKDHRGFYHVVELTTTRSNTEEGLTRAYDLKAFKYKYALEARAMRDKVVSYSIIVVSQDMVLSSIALPRSILSELIIRMRIGLSLENKAKSLGFSFETEERDILHQALFEEIDKHISSIPRRYIIHDDLAIKQDYIDSILEEPQEKDVVEIYLNSIKKAKVAASFTRDPNINPESVLKSFQEEFKTQGRKSNMKPVINLPLIVAKSTISNVDIPDLDLEIDPTSIESKLWSIAMDNYRTERVRNIDEDPLYLIQEAFETDIDQIAMYQKNRKSNRSKYHRVSVIKALTTLDKEELAEQGLWAKKYKNDTFYKERRKQSQKPFHWDTYTKDIDDFIANRTLFETCQDPLNRPSEYILRLLSRANHIVGNSDKGLQVVKQWMGTKLFRALDLISDIGMELSISNKQNCKSGDAILKKLRFHNAYILIFPTKSSEHMFFTLFFPEGEVLSELPFRRLHKTKDGYISTLVSVKQSKLENWCSASSSLITLAAFWSWFYEHDNDSPSKFIENLEASKMLLLTILVRLEDKAQTEESITLMRYMYMECFKGLITPTISSPLKVLSKISTNPRSRLTLWVIKTCTNQFLNMTLNPPVRYTPAMIGELIEGEDSLPKDTWKNLLNCFTGGIVLSASKVINLVYLGYLKNKNESPEGNTDFQLIEKTLEEELELDTTQLKYSRGEVPIDGNPKGKQFNKNAIMHGCKMMEKKMMALLGQNWKEHLGREILDKLAGSVTETIASLKASCTIKHHQCPKQASFTDPIASMRCKVLEAISCKLENFGLNPFTKLGEFITYIETTSRGIIADLFKKQQHGGLREIYVLTIESRIVQLFIEVISRTICSYFDEETLTHPKNKLRKLNEHRRLSVRLAQKRNCLSVDICSSNDKTRWNQNFVMTAMCIPLFRMTPTSFHPAIMRILNLWTNKLIKIPQSVCIHLLNRTEFASPIFGQMRDLFWSPTRDIPIFDFQNADCLRLRTGMMQGILHYTSSLLHLCFLSSTNRLIPFMLKNWFPTNSFSITQICSSDDSATMLSVFSPENTLQLDNKFIQVACYASLCLESLATVCKFYCMKESLKSTNGLIDYVEFNSEFLFCNTIAMPVIKFVAASLNLTESESFLDRFYTQYNLISDLFSSGFSAEQTHICQLSQAMFHYKTLGSSTNVLFREWCRRIVDWPDPKYGFFLVDINLMPGVLGYAYSHWMASIKTPIFQGTIRELNNEAWVNTPNGGITQSLIIKHGEVKRWKRLVDNVKGDMDLRSEIEKEPSLLFRSPKNLKELKIKFAIQATSPGVAKSMRRGNPFMQSVAMSVYAINTHAFSKTTVTQEHDMRVKKTEKVCILGELDRLVKSSRGEQRDFESSLLLAFPNKQRYEELQPLISQMRNSNLVKCHRFRERKNEVVIQPRSSQLPLSLKEVLMSRWFGTPIKASHKIYLRCLDVYKSTIPWLTDDIYSCLIESPFTTYQELYNFVSSSIEKTRTFRRNGPGLHSKRLSGQLYNLIRKSQRPCTILKEKEKRKYTIPSTDLITQINLALTIPNATFRRAKVLEVLRDEDKLYDDITSMSSMQRREATLAYIQGIQKLDFTMEDVAIHMRDMGIGTHISYVQEQRKQVSPSGEVKWEGFGRCYLFMEGCQIELKMRDDKLLELKVDNWKKLKANIYGFNQVIREMKLTPILDSSLSSRVLAKYNGSHMVSIKAVGCPVMMLPDRERVKFDPAGLTLRVEMGEIKIVQKVFSASTHQVIYEVCMLKYKMSHNDIILCQKTDIEEKDLWKAWINQCPCMPDTLFSYIKHAIRNKKTPMCSWLRETLQARLQFKNLGSFNIRYYDANLEYQEQEREEAESQEDKELMDMIMGGKFSLGEKMGTFVSQPTHETIDDWAEEVEREQYEEELAAIEALQHLGVSEALPMWVDHVKNWMEFPGEASTSVLGPAYGSFLSVHPLWDSVIDGFVRERQDFWYVLVDGKIPSGFEEPSKDLMSLLDVKIRKVEPVASMSDRYKLAREYYEGLPDDGASTSEVSSVTTVRNLELDIDEQQEAMGLTEESSPRTLKELIRQSQEAEDEDNIDFPDW